MGRRLEYEVKTSVRLNMSNPQHVKINDVIQNLDPKIFKSKNQFIIDAIQFYIDNYGKETFVIKKKEKERAEYIRSEDIEDIKEEVIEVATNEARKEVIRLLGGVISGMNVGQHFNNTMFYGNDMDRTMLRIGAMNMLLHGVENPNISYRDSLSEQNTDVEKYSLVLANPPFKGSLDYEAVSADLLKVTKTKKTELLFLALFLRILKKGGRAAVIVPDGVLFGSSKAHKQIRKEIIENNKLDAVISMPSGVFKPYAGVSTAILIFTKTGSSDTDKVWFYDMKADGLSLDDKRQEIADNDIPDIIERFNHLDAETDRKRTDQSFFVPVDEIVSNNYDLSINKYKEIVYEAVQYEPTDVIIGKIDALESEIQGELAELKKLLDV